MKHIFATLFICLAWATLAAAQDERPVAEVFAEKLRDMCVENDDGKVRNAQQDWQDFCFRLGAPGQEKRKAEVVTLMCEALGKEDAAAARPWLIRQLGRLGDASCVDAVAEFLDNPDVRLREETLWALGVVPANNAGDVLAKAWAAETDAAKKTALQNVMDYRAGLNRATLPALNEILDALSKNDPTAWDTPLAKLPWLHDVRIAAIPNAAERFAKMSPAAQVLLLDALAELRDRGALPLALQLVETEDETRRLAGFRALGPLGDASVLPRLVENIREGGDFGNTVRDSLCRLNFDGADAAIIDAYEKAADNAVKNELLETLRRRKGAIAVPVFEKALHSEDDGIRGRAIWALETLGEASSVPALIDRLFVEKDKGRREAIERALIQICSRYDDRDGRGVVLCELIDAARPDRQAVLLPVLGKIGGTAPRDLVLRYYRDAKTPEPVRSAAFRALCNWPDPDVAQILYDISADPGTADADKRAATRAHIRVITLHSDRSPKESLALFEKALDLANDAEDKSLLIARSQTARSREVFRFVVPFLEKADLAQAACAAVVDMANDHGFYMNNRAEIDPVLDKVIEISQTPAQVERAKRYKARPR